MQASKDAMLSSILVTEAQHPDFKKLDWENVLTTVADSLLLNAPIEQLPKLVRLALSIAIVGAEKTEYFGAVFRMMCDWEPLRGPYWVIQEELLRHSCISLIRETLGDNNDLSEMMDSERATEIRRALGEFLPAELAFVQHPLLRKKARELRVDIGKLVNAIEAEFDMLGAKSQLATYESQFPLHSFCAWFVEWAQGVLEASEPESVLVVEQRGQDCKGKGSKLCQNMDIDAGVNMAEQTAETVLPTYQAPDSPNIGSCGSYSVQSASDSETSSEGGTKGAATKTLGGRTPFFTKAPSTHEVPWTKPTVLFSSPLPLSRHPCGSPPGPTASMQEIIAHLEVQGSVMVPAPTLQLQQPPSQCQQPSSTSTENQIESMTTAEFEPQLEPSTDSGTEVQSSADTSAPSAGDACSVKGTITVPERFRLAWDDAVGAASGIGDTSMANYHPGESFSPCEMPREGFLGAAGVAVVSCFDPDEAVIY